jgi:hypothetical protein
MSDRQEAFWVAVVIAALAAIFLAAFLLSARSQAPTTPAPGSIYAGIPPDLHLLALDKKALDEAYHAQLLVLFNVWMKGQASDSKYFQNGLQNARRAYMQASAAIEAREKLLRDQMKAPDDQKKDGQQPPTEQSR